MAATPKHRRSASKKRSTRASNRYDVLLNKARVVKKNGGQLVHKEKSTGKISPAHMVTKDNPEYKGRKFITK